MLLLLSLACGLLPGFNYTHTVTPRGGPHGCKAGKRTRLRLPWTAGTGPRVWAVYPVYEWGGLTSCVVFTTLFVLVMWTSVLDAPLFECSRTFLPNSNTTIIIRN